MPVLLLGNTDRREQLITMTNSYFTPNERISVRSAWSVALLWILFALGWWSLIKPDIFPSPLDVLNAYPDLWMKDGLAQALTSSWIVNLEALMLSACIALPLAYVSRTPAFAPLADGLAELRVLSPAVFYLIIAYAVPTYIKVVMLAMGEAPFLATTMIGIVRNLPNERFDLARTLRMSEWQATWYVVVRGTMSQAFDAVRDNAAMGWAMLIMVEGIVRSEGGVGVLILNQEKHLNFAEIYAIAIAILVIGIVDDRLIGWIKKVCCPWETI